MSRPAWGHVSRHCARCGAELVKRLFAERVGPKPFYEVQSLSAHGVAVPREGQPDA